MGQQREALGSVQRQPLLLPAWRRGGLEELALRQLAGLALARMSANRDGQPCSIETTRQSR